MEEKKDLDSYERLSGTVGLQTASLRMDPDDHTVVRLNGKAIRGLIRSYTRRSMVVWESSRSSMSLLSLSEEEAIQLLQPCCTMPL